jgi:hypothetical protein
MSNWRRNFTDRIRTAMTLDCPCGSIVCFSSPTMWSFWLGNGQSQSALHRGWWRESFEETDCQCLRSPTGFNNNARDNGIDSGDDRGDYSVDALLAKLGLKPVPAPVSVNTSDMNSNTTKGGPTDSILRMAALTLWNNLWLLLFLFDPIHKTKNYPDYKMY